MKHQYSCSCWLPIFSLFDCDQIEWLGSASFWVYIKLTFIVLIDDYGWINLFKCCLMSLLLLVLGSNKFYHHEPLLSIAFRGEWIVDYLCVYFGLITTSYNYVGSIGFLVVKFVWYHRGHQSCMWMHRVEKGWMLLVCGSSTWWESTEVKGILVWL